MDNNTVLLGHGSGGKMAADLIQQVFISRFGSTHDFPPDAASLQIQGLRLAFTTDSYVVDPIFFPGGNIGKLAVCGTVNDLAVSGAKPLVLSAGFIIEEGFPMEDLRTIVNTMAEMAAEAGIRIVTGDTKVVPHGKCDKIFINTAGIGLLPETHAHISKSSNCKAGDKIIINRSIGNHSTAIMASRNHIDFDPPVLSDCAPLNHMIEAALSDPSAVHFMRDATRGGLATVLCELCSQRDFGVSLSEKDIPVDQAVEGFCELFGFDPLYMANEGTFVMVVDAAACDQVLACLRSSKYGENSTVIGELTSDHPSRVVLHTPVGGKRIVDMLAGEQLPRIC
jgi:hydrogenase expression/formation protein HypE